jgi:hypothetical protein
MSWMVKTFSVWLCINFVFYPVSGLWSAHGVMFDYLAFEWIEYLFFNKKKSE